MKRWWLLGTLTILLSTHAATQQIVFSNLKDLVAGHGDTLTTLKEEKRSKKQLEQGGEDQ